MLVDRSILPHTGSTEAARHPLNRLVMIIDLKDAYAAIKRDRNGQDS
ncbi:hypothetical protein UWK_00320 [Desulfocapsa sulfexigens DSM 10523]|uniref:Uncharacterized protein n=1 Tax=Desulfocapsa sulfexigens (strain DSM 10523 / SB164P1) TaxID=1167006 RepID=M1PAV3_DESSD|nr:hypothetical protein UWK_00320 [Desulfocapsa sulfexigens DSM 10523]